MFEVFKWKVTICEQKNNNNNIILSHTRNQSVDSNWIIIQKHCIVYSLCVSMVTHPMCVYKNNSTIVHI